MAEQFTVPVPLRPDVTAELRLPHDLTTAEASRIGLVLLALAVDALPKPVSA